MIKFCDNVIPAKAGIQFLFCNCHIAFRGQILNLSLFFVRLCEMALHKTKQYWIYFCEKWGLALFSDNPYKVSTGSHIGSRVEQSFFRFFEDSIEDFLFFVSGEKEKNVFCLVENG